MLSTRRTDLRYIHRQPIPQQGHRAPPGFHHLMLTGRLGLWNRGHPGFPGRTGGTGLPSEQVDLCWNETLSRHAHPDDFFRHTVLTVHPGAISSSHLVDTSGDARDYPQSAARLH